MGGVSAGTVELPESRMPYPAAQVGDEVVVKLRLRLTRVEEELVDVSSYHGHTTYATADKQFGFIVLEAEAASREP